MKKILRTLIMSLILVSVLTVTMFPTRSYAAAEEYDVWINDTQLTSENISNYKAAGGETCFGYDTNFRRLIVYHEYTDVNPITVKSVGGLDILVDQTESGYCNLFSGELTLVSETGSVTFQNGRGGICGGALTINANQYVDIDCSASSFEDSAIASSIDISAGGTVDIYSTCKRMCKSSDSGHLIIGSESSPADIIYIRDYGNGDSSSISGEISLYATNYVHIEAGLFKNRADGAWGNDNVTVKAGDDVRIMNTDNGPLWVGASGKVFSVEAANIFISDNNNPAMNSPDNYATDYIFKGDGTVKLTASKKVELSEHFGKGGILNSDTVINAGTSVSITCDKQYANTNMVSGHPLVINGNGNTSVSMSGSFTDYLFDQAEVNVNTSNGASICNYYEGGAISGTNSKITIGSSENKSYAYFATVGNGTSVMFNSDVDLYPKNNFIIEYYKYTDGTTTTGPIGASGCILRYSNNGSTATGYASLLGTSGDAVSSGTDMSTLTSYQKIAYYSNPGPGPSPSPDPGPSPSPDPDPMGGSGHSSEPPTVYNILAGTNSVWTKGSTEGVFVSSEATFDKFTAVKIDDVVIDPANYSAVAGSTEITLYPAYLETLSLGMHSIEIVSNDGYASTSFTVKADEASLLPSAAPGTTGSQGSANAASPKTGDDSNLILWGVMLLIGGSAFAGLLVYRLKMNKR